MKILVLAIAGVLCFVCACKSRSAQQAPAGPSSAELVSQANNFYRQRADLMQLREGIVSLRQAVTIDPGNYDASWQLAKFNYYLATHTDNNDERKKAFDEGIAAGKEAIALQPGKPDGHFWLGAVYGAAAERSILEGLASVNDIRHEMETVLQIDEGYQYGSAYMVLGLVYLNEPGIAGGDPNKAVELMEKGLRFGEGNAFLHLHLAEAYLKAGRPADARRQIDTIIAMKPDQDYLPEYNEALAAARKLSEKTGGF